MSRLINYRITMKSIAARYFLAENAAVSALHLRGEFAAHRLFEPFELAPQSIGRNDGQLATASPLLATYIFLTSIGRVDSIDQRTSGETRNARSTTISPSRGQSL